MGKKRGGTTLGGYDKDTLLLVAGYCITSSLLSIINKTAVKHFPYPSALSGLQYLTSAMGVLVMAAAGSIAPVEKWSLGIVQKLAPVVLVFFAAVYTNIKVLQHGTVETFIVLRSVSPLVVAVADPVFRPHAAAFPSARTWVSLLLIFAGAASYVRVESGFSTDSYTWGALYVIVICTDMVLVKDVVSKVNLSTWGLVFYNNILSFVVSVCVSLLSNEGGGSSPLARVAAALSTPLPGAAGTPASVSIRALLPSIAAVGTSCLFGFGISFCGLSVRRRVSATAFTVMGCTCKLATLLVNQAVVAEHASLGGQLCVLVSIAGGVLYSELAKRDAEMAQQAKAGGGRDGGRGGDKRAERAAAVAEAPAGAPPLEEEAPRGGNRRRATVKTAPGSSSVAVARSTSSATTADKRGRSPMPRGAAAAAGRSPSPPPVVGAARRRQREKGTQQR